ncbi:MAG: hypothetical protein IKJ15_03735 [Lachnospiraceae bacterium]|nr:hypothetical protein [Lachnospiraceae bacterium]
MQFNPINLFGFIIVVIMLIPNIIYGIKFKGLEIKCTNKAMNVIEQVGRYGSMALMVLPLFVWEFGFSSVFMMFVYVLGNGILLFTYLLVWVFYFKKQTMGRAMILAIAPTCIFFLSGVTLYHWALVVAAIIFGVGHIYVTYRNNVEG